MSKDKQSTGQVTAVSEEYMSFFRTQECTKMPVKQISWKALSFSHLIQSFPLFNDCFIS